MSRTLRAFAILAALALAAALAACSGGSSSTTPASTVAAAATAPAAGGATTVGVTLSEWSVKADQASVPAGKVDFKVKNGGTVAHEFVVIQTDLAPDKLPVKGSSVDTTALTVAGTLTQFDAGSSQDLALDLKPGHYVLICNLPGHYTLGMHAELTVK